MVNSDVLDIQGQDAEARAGIYWWLSTLFAQELKPEQLASYFDQQGQEFLNELSEAIPEKQAERHGAATLTQLKSALAALKLVQQPHLELAADFAQSFLGDNRTSALPYASVYLSDGGLLFQKPHDEMLELLRSQGLAVTDQFKEPADHLAIMLDFLGNMALRQLNTQTESERKALYQEQLSFIENRLLTWVPEFNQRCQGITGSGFYPAVAGLLCNYLDAERKYLSEQLD